jgi:hypothetical protein
MLSLKLVLMVLAVVCLGLHAAGVTAPRCNLQSAGLCLWALAVLLV